MRYNAVHQPPLYGPSISSRCVSERAKTRHHHRRSGQSFLYSVQDAQQALQYEVGVGKEGYGWLGVATVHDKKEWPDWYPTRDIMQRKPEIRQYMVQLQSGSGMHGGPDNPLGARALYLWQGNADTLYRIHGTNEPDSIGHNVSSGCIRMRNESAVDGSRRAFCGCARRGCAFDEIDDDVVASCCAH